MSIKKHDQCYFNFEPIQSSLRALSTLQTSFNSPTVLRRMREIFIDENVENNLLILLTITKLVLLNEFVLKMFFKNILGKV